ncbi:hypothetical protein [Plesiocystis pacifica]|nr:hypothetical protein [Plesiocystis pacifica]
MTTPIDLAGLSRGAGHGIWNTTIDGQNLRGVAFDFLVEQQGVTVLR